jgi:hypothetical protein
MIPVMPIVPLRVGLGVGLLLVVLVGAELHMPLLVVERLPGPVVLLVLYVLVLVEVRLIML